MAGKDYYKILGIQKDATDEQIKKAYKVSALKNHPDRNQNSAASSTAFKEIGEAYEVLSDGNKRAIYDQYGEEGLKAGGGGGAGNPGFAAGGSAGGFPAGGFSFGMPGGRGGGGGSGFQPSDPEAIFASLFGGAGGNPFMSSSGGMGGMPGGMGGGMGGMGGGNPFASMGGGFENGSPSQRPRKSVEIEKPLPVSLADLYKGTTKKMKIARANGGGDSVLSVNIKAGFKDGTKIKYPGAGGESADGTSRDIVFVISTKAEPNPTFVRSGNDLIHTVKVPLVDALTGPAPPATFTRSLQTLDGRTIKFDLPYPSLTSGGKPLSPTYEQTIIGEGFPISKSPTPKKGNLIITVEIVFPNRVTKEQAAGIRSLLGN